MTGKSPLRVFLFSTLKSTFIRTDYHILSTYFPVDWVTAAGARALARIARGVFRNDLAVVWFASTYAFFVVLLSKIAGKPTVIIVGGADAVRDEELAEGIWLSPWKSRLVRYAFRRATKVLVVDPTLEASAKRLVGYNGSNIEYIPTGFDAESWTPSGRKERLVLTVAACDIPSRIRVKGLDLFMEAAKVLSDLRFVIIGIRDELMPTLRSMAPANVEIMSFIPQHELLRHYQKAKVYCQVSLREGLPNALCEAMLCECVPVGTQRGGIPAAIGNTGYLVPYGDIPSLVGAIKSALSAPELAGQRARQRIRENFPLERREKGLLTVIHNLSA